MPSRIRITQALSVGVALLQACASAPSAEPARAPGDQAATVQFRIQNRLSETAVAYVFWEGNPRVFLGRLSTLQTRTFTTPQLADRVEVWCGRESGDVPDRPTARQSFGDIEEWRELLIPCY